MWYNLFMPSIVYQVGENLYLNITNRCTNQCGFCIRNLSRRFNKQHHLWLDREPTAVEVIEAIGDPSRYQQIVFCGYGEPLIRLDVVKNVAERLATGDRRPIIRLDTNGQANLFWGRNILPELQGLIDSISISLDTENAKKHLALCRPAFGPLSYQAVLDFIKEAKKYIPKVELSIVDLPLVDKAACRQIAQELGVKFRLRPYYQESYVR
jgi:TatD family-associated radical SAM protein